MMNNAQQKYFRNAVTALKLVFSGHINGTPLRESAEVRHAKAQIKALQRIVDKHHTRNRKDRNRRFKAMNKAFEGMEGAILFESPDACKRKLEKLKAKTF